MRTLRAEAVRAAAAAARFPVVGLARAEALDRGPLERWLAAGHAADMEWMHRRQDERLDPGNVLPGARTVLALGIPYRRPAAERAARSPVAHIASYARGRDYHYVHRDRLKALRKRLLELDPAIETYACVDTGVAMEKVWAERAGIGWIGKNGLLINPRLGSWLTLSVMFLDRAVDHYDRPHANLCGDCAACQSACPTGAFASPGVVDSRRCISYQSIENQGVVPLPLRKGFTRRVFGCDVCQDVCPYNGPDVPIGDPKFAPRPLAELDPAAIAALSREDFARLAAGMALMRPQYDGLRRNAVLALGASRDRAARDVVARLTADASPVVREAAVWALGRIDHRPRTARGRGARGA